MPDLTRITRYKNKLMEQFASSQSLVDLILNAGADPDQFTHYPVPNSQIPYANLFPYDYRTDDSNPSPPVFLTLTAELSESENKAFTLLNLYVSVYAAYERMECTTGPRADLLAEAVDDILRHAHEFGLGRLKRKSLETAEAPPGYGGLTICYESQEWSK